MLHDYLDCIHIFNLVLVYFVTVLQTHGKWFQCGMNRQPSHVGLQIATGWSVRVMTGHGGYWKGTKDCRRVLDAQKSRSSGLCSTVIGLVVVAIRNP